MKFKMTAKSEGILAALAVEECAKIADEEAKNAQFLAQNAQSDFKQRTAYEAQARIANLIAFRIRQFLPVDPNITK